MAETHRFGIDARGQSFVPCVVKMVSAQTRQHTLRVWRFIIKYPISGTGLRKEKTVKVLVKNMPTIQSTATIPANDRGGNPVLSKVDNCDAQSLRVVGERGIINDLFNTKTIIFSPSEDV